MLQLVLIYTGDTNAAVSLNLHRRYKCCQLVLIYTGDTNAAVSLNLYR